MQSISFRKVKSVAKDISVKSPPLWELILETMHVISRVVGGTLGPGGCPVLIERQEDGMPNIITKDGVTVYRSLGFANPTQHALMESARDASVRTADEAGDGTTTATILSEALVRYLGEYLKANPRVSSQKVLRQMEFCYRQRLEPTLRSWSSELALTPEVQKAVVMCSTNGDAELSKTVLECFAITGDAGNVTILEEGGPSGYRVEPLKGYSLGVGYEESCRRFVGNFINDEANGRVYLEKPAFILYFGEITDITMLFPLFKAIEAAQQEAEKRGETITNNYVVVATGFSDTVLAQLAGNFRHQNGVLKVFPVLLPKTPVHNSEMQTLHDIAALTGGTIFERLGRQLDKAKVTDLGQPLDYFEALRYRSNIVGHADGDLVIMRIEELERALLTPESKFEKMMLRERIAKLSGGIAKLTVIGPSTGEIREKKDRAEDAVCALRGALKHGVLPGACWALTKLAEELRASSSEVSPLVRVLAKALDEPFKRLTENAGLTEDETRVRRQEYPQYLTSVSESKVWDGFFDRWVPPVESGIVDSLPAVNEALRTSLSIAGQLGSLGGCVVFPRDLDVERKESADTYAALRSAAGV